jgi:hypothetical protein
LRIVTHVPHVFASSSIARSNAQNRYIHGEISRRDFLDGSKRFAIAGLAATTIVEALPELR